MKTSYSRICRWAAPALMADRHLGRMFIDLGNTNSMGMLSDLLYSETTVAAKTDMGSANIRANFADNVTPSSWMETGNNCLLTPLVIGYKRVPDPPANTIPFIKNI